MKVLDKVFRTDEHSPWSIGSPWQCRQTARGTVRCSGPPPTNVIQAEIEFVVGHLLFRWWSGPFVIVVVVVVVVVAAAHVTASVFVILQFQYSKHGIPTSIVQTRDSIHETTWSIGFQR